MIFYLIAAVFAFLGVIFWFMEFLGAATDTKNWAKFCIITSGLLITFKLYLENQEAVHGFVRSFQ